MNWRFIFKPSRCCSSVVITTRTKTTSARYVASRARDPTFKKLMEKYKSLLKVVAIQDLFLASSNPSSSISLDFLNRLSQKLRLNRGAASFLHKYPHIFQIFYDTNKSQSFCKLTNAAIIIALEVSQAIKASMPLVVDRLLRLLLMTSKKSLPLCAAFKVWRELCLPDDFEDSVISRNSNLFRHCDGHEPNTHILKLADVVPEKSHLTAAVENWRVIECCREDSHVDRTEIRFSFKHGFPPAIRLSKDWKAKAQEWQRLPYVGPYEGIREKRKSKAAIMVLEK
ncbi:hypothetical protein ACJRO7_034114 [Eucalyptus globulus]|uniref:PORR domain-containing protein n=1 Tax=Eucalyptus globulus TaxID=34317 RepID=A0ABD3J5L4_EUCGL